MNRSSRAAALLGVALLLAAILLWASGRAPSAALPVLPDTVAEPRLPAGLGVNVALQRYGPAELENVLRQVAGSGFGWIRQRFPWDEIEPARAGFQWALWDAIVEAATRQGLTLVAVLDGSPAWARAEEDAGNALAPPRQRGAFGRFAAAFAARYGDRIRYYQVWDEPNIAPHWGAGPVDASAYAGLLREAAVQLRAADPDAVIMAAALAPNVEPGGTNQSDLAYLAGLYTAGAAPWFDVAAGQPYGFDRPPADPPDPQVLNFNRAALLRDVMRQHGDQETALWLAAYGWHSALPGQAGNSPWKTVDEATQAAWAVQALDWTRLHWPWLGGLAWATWQPEQPVDDPHWGFALVEPGGQPRPVLAALQQWTSTAHPLGSGAWPPTTPAIQEQGGWRLMPGAADPPLGAEASPGNNRLTIPFEGSTLALRVQGGPYWAYLDVTVDGQPANALPRDDQGRANLVLYDPLAAERLVTVAQDLDAGPHLAEVVAAGGWEQWPLLEIVVQGPPAVSGPGRLPWLLGLAGLVSLVLAVPAVGSAASRLAEQAGQLLTRTMAYPRPWPGWVRYILLAATVLVTLLLPSGLRPIPLAALFALLVVFPDLGLPLLAALTPLFLVPLQVLGRGFSPVELAVSMIAAAWLVRGIIGYLASHSPAAREERRNSVPAKRLLWRASTLDWPVLALVVVAAMSLLVADNFGVAAREFRTVVVSGALAYGLVRLAPAGGGHFDPWPLVWGIALGAALVAVWGAYQMMAGTGLITAEGVVRVRGPYGSPNNLALYLSHTLPILLAVAFLASTRSRRLAAALLAAPVLLGLVLTFSKGGLLLGLPVAVLFLGFAAGGRWRWLAVGAVLLGAVAMVPLFRTERFGGLFDLHSGTSFLRLQLWRGAWNMVLDHPWLGVGLDNFLYAYRTTYVLPSAWQEPNLSHPHNVLLDFWTRLGLLGVLVGIWLFAAAFRLGWRALSRLAGDERALMLGLLASLVATLAHGLIDNSVFLVDLMVLFMLSLGLIARLASGSTPLDSAKGN